MKKILVIIICLAALNVWAVENLSVNGVTHYRWEDRTTPVLLTGQMSSPSAKLIINVYEDANRDGKVSGGEYLLRSYTVRGNVGPIGDGKLFPGNIATGGTNQFTIPIYPLVCDGYGSIALTVQVIDQDGSKATVKVTAPAENPNVFGIATDTNGNPVLGISVAAYGTDTQSGESFSRSSISDSGGNFGFNVPPGEQKMGGWPYVNSLVQYVSDLPLSVPQQGTITPTLEMIPNSLFINGYVSGPEDQFSNLLVSANRMGTGQDSYALTSQTDNYFHLGVSQPGEYTLYIGPYNNEYVWPQSFTTYNQYFPAYVDTQNPMDFVAIEVLPNNVQVAGAIRLLYDGALPSDGFGYLNVNGFFQIDAYVNDAQTGNGLEYRGYTDSVEQIGKSQKSFASQVADSASSPYLDGNAYTIYLRPGEIYLSGIAPFGYISMENSHITATAGETIQGPTMVWNITSDDVLFIEGVVRYPDGSPAQGVTVVARTESNWDDRSTQSMSKTDAEGRYRLPYLQKFSDMGEDMRDIHTYHVGVYLAGYTTEIQEVVGETSGVHTVNFDLSESSGVAESHTLPRTCELEQNYPNPFNPKTTISYTINTRAPVSLKVYSVDGRLVTTLVDGVHAPGAYKVSWDASNSASGIYLLVMKTSDLTHIRKCTLLK